MHNPTQHFFLAFSMIAIFAICMESPQIMAAACGFLVAIGCLWVTITAFRFIQFYTDYIREKKRIDTLRKQRLIRQCRRINSSNPIIN
jgi:hypothetical protein